MDALLRAALAMPDCPIALASSSPTSNGHNLPIPPSRHHQQHHYQLPDKHVLAARLRAQLGRAAQRANLNAPPHAKQKPAHHIHLHHHHHHHGHSLTIPSVPSTPTPTSSCADPDTDMDLHHDLDAFTTTWTLASGPLSPPASIARFSCAPTHLIPQVTLPLAAHLGPHGEPMAAVSHHLASECRSVASIHVVTSNGHHGPRSHGARRQSFVYYDDRGGDSEDDLDEEDESEGEWGFAAASATATTNAGSAAAASSSGRGPHFPPAAYAEMEEAAWTILRMMQDSQVLPSQQIHELPTYPPSSSSSPSTPSSPSKPDAMDIDTPAPAPADTPIPSPAAAAAAAVADADNAEAEGDSTIELVTPTKPDQLTSSPPASTLTHRLALTRRRVQSELAHRRPAALTLTPTGAGQRRGSLSSAGSSPSAGPLSASSATTRMPFPVTPTSAAARSRRRSLSASEHLIMGQLARSPLAIAFSKQQAAAVAEVAEPATSPDRTAPPAPAPAPARRPLLTSASTSSRRSGAAASPSPSPSSARIPRELANLADFLKPPPHESTADASPAKMAASPLSATLLASGAPVDLLVASVVASTGTSGVGARRAAAARLGTIDVKETAGVSEVVVKSEPVGVGVSTRKRTRRGAAVAAAAAVASPVASDGDEDKVDEEEAERTRARKRPRKAAAPALPAPVATNGRTRAAAAPSVSAIGNARRGRAKAAAKPASPPPVQRMTRGRAAGRAVVKEEPEDDESLSDADEMDDTASLSSVPSSPEL